MRIVSLYYFLQLWVLTILSIMAADKNGLVTSMRKNRAMTKSPAPRRML